ncbi:PH domain-containing protein [Pseudoalteromonas sp. MMG010]|uniref:PH domain-containing protein n=1 Tax=Pseudoalteromonas sp. MMG010 TaxID=2822685 RepID=UPI001B3A427F|nr:PH domain-containing protein [Pseudoalteromonas sp. MMG010]MBQ4834058.1 PH domain-containing protein [Pseudoalteromonas sp. MMG010]
MTSDIHTHQNSQPVWQKVSPWALVYFVVHFSVRFVKDGLLNLLPMLVVFVTQVENKLFWGQIAALVAVCGLVLYSLLYYLNFKYSISDDNEILLNKGVLQKERLTLKFSRVQNVNIATPFYFTPVNLVNCIFDAAGSTAQEVVLPGVTNEYAQAMRKQIFTYKEKQQIATSDISDDTNDDDYDEKSLLISNKEIAKFGLMSNMAILAFAAAAPFINATINFLEKQLIANLEGFYKQELGLITTAAAFAVATLVVMLFLMAILLSVAMALARFYNFEVYFKDAKFKRISGLLERHQLTMSLDKVQSIVIKQNIMSRLLKRYTLQCLQASSGGWGANAAKKNKQTLVLPVLTKPQVNSVCQWVYPWFDSEKLIFKGAHRALLYKNLAFFAALPSVVIFGLCIALELTTLISVGGVIVLSGLVTLSYQGYGYYLHQDQGRHYLVIRKGMIGVQYRVFELYKAQSAHSISTYFMRKSSLSSVHIQLASGFAFMPYIKTPDANYLIDFTLYQVESDTRSWM